MKNSDKSETREKQPEKLFPGKAAAGTPARDGENGNAPKKRAGIPLPGVLKDRFLLGMVLCVEPMLNLGSHRVYTESDGWTVRTRDGEPSAHFEHMILITENGTEVLTRV